VNAPRVVITGSGLYTPAASISNDELVASFNHWADGWNAAHADAIATGHCAAIPHSSTDFIVKASGIRARYVLDREGILDPDRMAPFLPERADDEHSIQCEMGLAAARAALLQAGCEATTIDGVIVACSNLQRPYPAIAIELQAALGIGGYAFDMNVACSSATFALQQARDSLLAGSAQRLLIVNPEICSGHLNFRDRDAHFIFGDVCTALVVERVEGAARGWEILGTRLQTQFSNNIRNNFGFLNRADERGINRPDKLFVQQGRKVFKEVCPLVAEQILAHAAALGIAPAQLRRLWLHQANLGMNQLIARRVLGHEASFDEAPIVLDEYANTSSAGSVIAFHKHRADLAVGDIGVICSFGAGYSIGSVIVQRTA